MNPSAKEIVMGILGSSVSIAGLLLVFSGFLFSQAANLPPEAPDRMGERFRLGGKIGIAPFLGALAVAALALVWLLHPSSILYWLVVGGFSVLLIGTAVYGAITILRYL